MTTAYKRLAIGGLITAGVTAAVPLFSMPETGGTVAAGASAAAAFFKGAKLGTIILAAVLLALKLGIAKVIVIQEGETGLLVKRGRVALDKKTNLPRLVNANRYQVHLAVVRHIAIVSNRERTINLGALPVTIGGETWVAPLELVWSIKGDPTSMRDALIKVSDGNRFDEKFGALETMIRAQAISALTPVFSQAALDKGVPKVDYACVKKSVKQRLKNYGCKYHQILPQPMHRYAEQHSKDGQLAIANAIQALTPPASTQSDSDVTDQPRLASA